MHGDTLILKRVLNTLDNDIVIIIKLLMPIMPAQIDCKRCRYDSPLILVNVLRVVRVSLSNTGATDVATDQMVIVVIRCLHLPKCLLYHAVF